MTFSAAIKEELCKTSILNTDCALAELCGLILFANTAKSDIIKVITENNNVARRASFLLKRLFGFDFDKKIVPLTATKRYSLIIENREKIAIIANELSLDFSSLRLNAANTETDETRAAFCRGAFLTGGSATDPESGYHLELVTSHQTLSREVISLLLDLELNPKLTFRKSNNIIYFKESGNIEDFLTRIGAPLAVLEFMQTKLVKDLRNSVNRKINFEIANGNKLADAAKVHIQAIRLIAETDGLESLPPQLYEVAKLRLENPEASLAVLSELTNGEVGKSGLNHRLAKIIAIANDISKRKDACEK